MKSNLSFGAFNIDFSISRGLSTLAIDCRHFVAEGMVCVASGIRSQSLGNVSPADFWEGGETLRWVYGLRLTISLRCG
ncbi:hypothetical protein Pla144_27630 [Bythopirellula polymerisocia]|uniref:Uncharacterized protein n=1 Tax=Bythopirellula polymerisocia TaxID=2528003 RepID=A0A5C6CR19_9BACT|nr:hypothetical protein Pla144_27630 [Bythopirellula polymerisocia]